MLLENKITIKRILDLHPFLAMSLLTESDEAIQELADKSRLSTAFIKNNLKIIRQWI